MIFEFETSCFANGANALLFASMANIALKGRHRIYVRCPEDKVYKDWLETLGRSLQEEWQAALDASMTLEALEPARYSITVCTEAKQSYDPDSLALNLSSSERLVREPFRVFVENDGADRDFLLTFSSHDQVRKILELEEENLLSFEHCGGITELPKKVSKYALGSNVSFLNCSAVFDSDAPFPGAISTEANTAKNTCENCGISPYILRRRAIENYIERSWLNVWVNKSPKSAKGAKLKIFESYCKLSLEQRSHFHMKRGLKVDKDGLQTGKIKLYEGVSDEDLRTLNDGFGESLAADLYAVDWVQSTQMVDDTDAWEEVNGMINEILVLCR